MIDLSDHMVLISDPGQHTLGGLYVFDGADVATIDNISTTGLASVGGTRFARLLRTPDEPDASGELLLYDATGVERYVRLDGIVDGHDVAWDGRSFIVVATARNKIVWLDVAGDVTREWKAAGDGDAWHLNSLLVHGGSTLVCAFGRFSRHREWRDGCNGTGLVFDVDTGATVLEGLSSPHDPRFVDGRWIVCNSADGEVLIFDESGQELIRRVVLEGFTRGLAVTDDFVLVGESADRNAPGEGRATLAVISRRDWTLVERHPVPGDEIFNLLLVPRALVDGARRGFRTNPARARTVDTLALFHAVGAPPGTLRTSGTPLAAEDMRATVTARAPSKLETDTVYPMECSVENRGRSVFASAPPNPVHVSYRWLTRDGAPLAGNREPLRTALPSLLPPRVPITCFVDVRTPSAPGAYRLRLTLVQEAVAWFDSVDEDSVADFDVSVDAG